MKDGKVGDFCSKEERTHPINVQGEIAFIDKAGSIFSLLFTLEHGKDLSKLNSLSIEGTSDWLLRNIEKYPNGASTIGLGISVWLLYDSISDNAAVDRIKKEYENLLKTPADIFKKPEHHLEHIIKRSNEIRGHVIEFKSWQMKMAAVKSVVSIFFGWIGFSTGNPTVKPLAYAASGFAGAGAILNAYNWGALHKLVHQLEETGYII